MAQVDQEDETGELGLILLEQQIQAMERPARDKQPLWPRLLVGAAVVAMTALCVPAYSAYSTIARIDADSNIAVANPVVLFQDVATNGPRVGSTVDASSRATYTRALEQFVLDGTGVVLALALAVAGVFVLANL